jgi:hypothetical protein
MAKIDKKKSRERLETFGEFEKSDVEKLSDSLNESQAELESQAKEIFSEYEKSQKKVRFFNRKSYTIFGFIVMGFALLGIILLTVNIVNFSKHLFQRDVSKYEEIILPVVISDVPAFENVSDISSDKVISSAIWEILLFEDITEYSLNFDVITIPELDIETAAKKIFGEFKAAHKNITIGAYSIYYDSTAKTYVVPVLPDYFSYKPQIKSVEKPDNSTVVLRVAYYPDRPDWQNNLERVPSNPAKYTIITLTDNVITKIADTD